LFELLEPRLVLSADLILDLSASDADQNLIIRVDAVDLDNDSDTPDVAALQVIRSSNGTDTVLAEEALGAANSVNLTTGGGADAVLIEAGSLELPSVVTSLDITLTLGGGGDTVTVDSTSLGSVIDSFTPSIDVDLEGGTDELAFSGGFEVAFTIDAVDGGSAADGVVSVTFSSTEFLTGGTADDTFSLRWGPHDDDHEAGRFPIGRSPARR
jgi:hypothetical protein